MGDNTSVSEQTNDTTTPVTKTEYLDSTGRAVKVTDAAGNTTITYKDEWGNIKKKTDGEGNEWNYTYNTQNKLLTATDPLGTVTKYEYDTYGNRTKETQAAGTEDEAITTYTYNEYNELTSTTKETATTTYTYNDAGNVTEIKDAQNNKITMTYDQAGNLLTTIQPLIGTTTYEAYDYKGNPGKITDPNGNIIIYTYDILGRVKTTTNQADNSTTQFSYITSTVTSCTSCGGASTNGTGKIASITLPEGNKINYDYDNVGNLIQIMDNEGNSINYTYDKKGNKTKEEIKDTAGALQKTLSYQYDIINRLTRQINPDNSFTEYGYDKRGSRATLKDPNGNTTTYSYDAANRLIKVTQPGNTATSYTYDRRGNLKTVTDANGNITTYEYDKRNRLTKTISPDTGITVYTYDLNGNLKTKTDAKNITITYTYEAANRLTKIDFPEDTDIIYTYDTCINGKGRLCTMTDQSGTSSYEYSAKGQVTKETKTIDTVIYTTEYTYDKNGNIKTMKYPSGRVITYNYTNDKLTGILNNGAQIASDIGYKPFGGMKTITYGNGLTGTVGYDNQYRIATLTAGTVVNYTYTYDANGNITGISNMLEPTKNKAFTYDALDRLATASGAWGSLGWTYDKVGNRQTQANGDTSTYAYQAGTNKLMGITGALMTAFTFDNNGNTLTENTKQFIYNQNQRLIKAMDNGSVLGEYLYSGNGQRVKKSVKGQTTVFHYSLGGQIVAESDSAGAITAEYVYLNSQPLAKIEGANVYYYHNDHLATPHRMTDASGRVVWAADYKPFGEATVNLSSTITNNLRFPGQYYDEETGLHQNYYRDYDWRTGRYIEADMIGIQRGMNDLYAYVKNNPLFYSDPLGLKCTFISSKLAHESKSLINTQYKGIWEQIGSSGIPMAGRDDAVLFGPCFCMWKLKSIKAIEFWKIEKTYIDIYKCTTEGCPPKTYTMTKQRNDSEIVKKIRDGRGDILVSSHPETLTC